jgi:hypothetical protein
MAMQISTIVWVGILLRPGFPGSVTKRQTWFLRGYRGAGIAECDTFSGSI